MIGSREAASMGLHHPSELLARPYADQLVHQVGLKYRKVGWTAMNCDD